jgi:hypothetical protein
MTDDVFESRTLVVCRVPDVPDTRVHRQCTIPGRASAFQETGRGVARDPVPRFLSAWRRAVTMQERRRGVGIEVSNEQLRSTPVRVVNPETNEEYVVIRAAVYDRLHRLTGDDDVRQLEPLLAELSPEDWEDASAYDRP